MATPRSQGWSLHPSRRRRATRDLRQSTKFAMPTQRVSAAPKSLSPVLLTPL